VDKLLFTSMTGATRAMQSQAIDANNLANIDTIGFKGDLQRATAFAVQGDVFPSRVMTQIEPVGSDFSKGSLMTTDRDLDVAIQGEGWFVVMDAEGKEAFTRSGELLIDANGMMLTRDNFPVIGNAGPVSLPPYEQLEIGIDGVVSVRALGQGPESLSEVNRLKLVNPDIKQLVKGSDGLFRRRDGLVEPADASVHVIKGALENSNVNAVASMMQILSSARQFELNVQLMSKAEEMDRASAQLLQLN
jgi:flagellar basal-body rod protein FlgF